MARESGKGEWWGEALMVKVQHLFKTRPNQSTHVLPSCGYEVGFYTKFHAGVFAQGGSFFSE